MLPQKIWQWISSLFATPRYWLGSLLGFVIQHWQWTSLVILIVGYELIANREELLNLIQSDHRMRTIKTGIKSRWVQWLLRIKQIGDNRTIAEKLNAGVKVLFHLFWTPLAVLVVTLGNFAVAIAFKLPVVNRRRKRFEKEALPVLRFKTWRSVVVMALIATAIAWMLTNYFVGVFRALVGWLSGLVNTFNANQLENFFDWTAVLPQNLLNTEVYSIAPVLAYPLLAVTLIVAWRSAWINFEQYRDYNHNEAGDDRFSTIAQLKREYKIIPDKQKSYPGQGGLPIIHLNRANLNGATLHSKMLWRNKTVTECFTWAQAVLGWTEKQTGYYLIDDDTINELQTGMTRSGKGETTVNPTIDILSRATIKSSMCISDPKGELYQSAYATLRRRGYDVEVLSFQNMDWSMSYNPLELAIQAAKKGYYEKVQQLVNAVAESIYRDPKADPKNKYWEDTSISLFNAIAMALIDRANEAIQSGEEDAWDTITIRNITKFLTDLGSENMQVDANGDVVDMPEPGQPVTPESALTRYFDHLRKVNAQRFSKFREMADINFRESDFAADETKGNVYSSMMAGITLFLQDDVAKMTSKNSIDIRSIGNPRRLTINFPSGAKAAANVASPFRHWTAKISIFSNGSRLGSKPTVYVKDQTCLIDGAGYLEAMIKPMLPESFRIAIRVAPTEADFNTSREYDYMLRGKKQYVGQRLSKLSAKKDQYTGKRILKDIQISVLEQPPAKENEAIPVIDKTNVEFVYSEKPKAVFMVTPPNRPEYNSIVAFFIDQVFNANYDDALNAPGRKCQNRIQFLLDEFANIPAIPKMDLKLSIGLGQNIQFLLIVQALEQIADKYGEKTAQTIIGNCSINTLLKTTSDQTAEAYSKLLGKRTITRRSKSTNVLNESDPHIDFANVEQELMTPTQLLKLEAGEAVMVRGVKAQDKFGRKVTADPVFIHGASELPYRYMFLSTEFNQKTSLSDIPVHSDHRGLDLQTVAVDAMATLKQIDGWLDQLGNDANAHIQPRVKKESNEFDMMQDAVNHILEKTNVA